MGQVEQGLFQFGEFGMRLRLRQHHKVEPSGEFFLLEAERLAEAAFPTVSLHRIPNFPACDDQSQPILTERVLRRIHHQRAIARR